MPPKRGRGQSRKKSGDNDDSDYAPPPESEPESDEEDEECQDDEASLSLQPRLRGKKVPIPCTILPDFYGNGYSVDLSANRDESGEIIWPDRGKNWEVSMEIVPDDEFAALLDKVPLVGEIRDLAREALLPYKEENPDLRKRGGSGTIGLTFAVRRKRRGGATVEQLYFFQKKLGIIVGEDYAGSFRARPVVDVFFDPDVRVYELDLEVTVFKKTHEAEGVAWSAGMTHLGAGRRHLCEQMPIKRLPPGGLSSVQRLYIESLRRKHPLKWLLGARAGTEFEVGFSNLGKMTPKAAAAHLRLVNAGLALNNHADLVTIGEATRFTAGPGGRGSETRFTAGPQGTGATIGKATQLTAGPNGTGAQSRFGSGEDHPTKTQATEPWMLAQSHARDYFMLVNVALHCAATDEAPDPWASRLLTRPKLACTPLKTLEFRDSVRTGAPVQDLKIVGARINPGLGGWERKYVFDVLREDGGVGTWASYDLAVALKLIGPRTKPPSSPGRKGYWQHLLKPWPVFSRRRKRARR